MTNVEEDWEGIRFVVVFEWYASSNYVFVIARKVPKGEDCAFTH